MALITLQELIDDAKDRADMSGSDFISDAAWKRNINKGLGNLYDMLVKNFGDDCFTVTGSEQSVAAGAGSLTLPTDFYKLDGIDYKSGNCWLPMKDFQFAERSLVYDGSSSPKYCLQLDKLMILPTSHAAFTYRLIYIKEFSKLSNMSDSFDFKSSWDDYVVCKAALKAKDKEESDVSVLMAELQAAELNIMAMSPNRDANRPKKVIDVEAVNYFNYE